MTWTFRAAEKLIRHACRRLPEPEQGDRRREWTAELYAVLEDADAQSARGRALRALWFAADQHRSVHRLRATVGRRSISDVAASVADDMIGFIDGLLSVVGMLDFVIDTTIALDRSFARLGGLGVVVGVAGFAGGVIAGACISVTAGVALGVAGSVTGLLLARARVLNGHEAAAGDDA